MGTGGHPESSKLGSVDDPRTNSTHDEVKCHWLVFGCAHDHI